MKWFNKGNKTTQHETSQKLSIKRWLHASSHDSDCQGQAGRGACKHDLDVRPQLSASSHNSSNRKSVHSNVKNILSRMESLKISRIMKPKHRHPYSQVITVVNQSSFSSDEGYEGDDLSSIEFNCFPLERPSPLTVDQRLEQALVASTSAESVKDRESVQTDEISELELERVSDEKTTDIDGDSQHHDANDDGDSKVVDPLDLIRVALPLILPLLILSALANVFFYLLFW
jgi:hypothetical protein